jgi:hypothetical protein
MPKRAAAAAAGELALLERLRHTDAAPRRKMRRSAKEAPSGGGHAGMDRSRPLARRGVSAAFLDDLMGPDGTSACGLLTPGQLVHGRNTAAGDGDAWRRWKDGADPLCARSLTLESGVSLVEAFIDAAEASGDERLTHSAGGAPYFGDVTDFVSYTWHSMSCGELWQCLKTRAARDDATGLDGVFHWIDIFAVAQNAGPKNEEDLDFTQAIKASRRAVAVLSPWSYPSMLGRCWCLHELHVVHMLSKPLVVAVPASEAVQFKPRAIAANFASILSTIVTSVDCEQAAASREEDRTRILRQIRDTCGYEELTVQVLTLMNEWLRSLIPAHNRAAMQPARHQIEDRIQWLKEEKRQARQLFGSDKIKFREEDGVVSIGGQGGKIIGGTDASRYLEPPLHLNGKRICFAGELKTMSRASATAAATAAGAAVSSAVAGVDVVVAGPFPDARSKLEQARATERHCTGIAVWTEEDFRAAMSGANASSV